MLHFNFLRTAAVSLLVIMSACATSPLGRSQIMLVSNDQMNEMGIASYQQMKKDTPSSKDVKQSAYVRCVANAITAQVGGQWEVTLFDDKAVNAFALPGGKIGVYTGILKVANSQDQLAAIIGHEVSHVLAGHSAERVSNQMVTELGTSVASSATGIDPQVLGLAGNVFFLLPYSRTHETEADLLGLDLMAKAGFNPNGAILLWQNMAKASGDGKPPEMLSTHPSDATRSGNLQKRLATAMPLYEQARARGLRPNCGT